MRRWAWAIAALLVLRLGWALEPMENTQAIQLPKPIPLADRDKIKDSAPYSFPSPPRKYFDGTRLNLANETTSAPDGPAILDLNDPLTLQQIPKVNRSERSNGRYYWHPYKAWNYCHLRQGKFHWYGWRTGGNFHWVLWHSGHFWWHDPQAGRWLYFSQGYWWWQGSPGEGKAPLFEALLEDGHYHVCGPDGWVGANDSPR